MATQATHLLSRVHRVRYHGNRMSRPRVPEALSAVEVDFRKGVKIGLRDLLVAEKVYRI
jgi:hypothetical protein